MAEGGAAAPRSGSGSCGAARSEGWRTCRRAPRVPTSTIWRVLRWHGLNRLDRVDGPTGRVVRRYGRSALGQALPARHRSLPRWPRDLGFGRAVPRRCWFGPRVLVWLHRCSLKGLAEVVAMGYTTGTTMHRVSIGPLCALRRLGFGRTPDPTVAPFRGGRSCVEREIVKAYSSRWGSSLSPPLDLLPGCSDWTEGRM